MGSADNVTEGINYSLLAVMSIFLVVIVYLTFTTVKNYKEDTHKQMNSNITEGLQMNVGAIFYHLIFIIRRVLFVVMIFAASGNVWL